MTAEQKAKAYDEAIKRAKAMIEVANNQEEIYNSVITIFPEFKESEDERIRKGLLQFLNAHIGCSIAPAFCTQHIIKWIEWLEKQGEQKPSMIQWKGNNLKEVIDFTGIYKDGFEKWFHNSWEEYEKYVHEHNNIFKIFNKDGSHIEVPVGAWIVKTPDGYNTASRYAFKQKPAWSEEDKKKYCNTIELLEDMKVLKAKYDLHPLWVEQCNEAISWLKSLKDRVQPKQEWSEEDEKGLADALWCCSRAVDTTRNENEMGNCSYAENWLKSLRPQNKWKPSDEQKPAENSQKVSESSTEEKDMTEYEKGFECGKQRILKYPEDFGLCKNYNNWSEEDYP